MARHDSPNNQEKTYGASACNGAGLRIPELIVKEAQICEVSDDYLAQIGYKSHILDRSVKVGKATKGRKDVARSSPRVTFKLLWGLFCKSIVRELESSPEHSLIGILPSLEIHVRTLPRKNKESFRINLPLWFCANLAVEKPLDATVETTIEVLLTLTGETTSHSLKIAVKPNELTTQLNVKIVFPNGLPVVEGLQKFDCAIKHENRIIGTVELPINVKVETVNKLG